MSQRGFSRAAAALAVVLLVAGLAIGYLAGATGTPTEARTVTSQVTVFETKETTKSITVTVTKTERPSLPPVRLDVSYAELFSVEYRDGYKIVHDALNRTIILLPRGSEPPRGVEGLIVHIPVSRVVLLSATQAALIERLTEYRPEVLSSIVGLAGAGDFEWYLENIREAIKSGAIKDIGTAFSPNLEEVVALEPDIMFIYTLPGDELPAKLDELGIPYAVDNEWLEKSVLGRFEWIKFIAAFYDMESEAAELFDSIEKRVAELRDEVSGLSQPVVAWFSVYKGTAYASGGASYTARALEELGAEYIFSDVESTGSIRPSLEELVARTLRSDVIIYASYFINSLEELLAEVPGIEGSEAVKSGRVYRFTETYYQLGYAYPDSWYMDLAAILYPEAFPDHELRFFKRIE